MITEIDLLKEDLPRLEAALGASHPFVEVLKAELGTLPSTANLKHANEELHPGFWAFIQSLFR